MKTLPYEETVATAWGNAAHKAAEDFINSNGRQQFPDQRHPENGKSLRDYQWCVEAVMNRAAQRGGQIVVERSMAETRDKQPTDFWDKAAWIRGKIDVTILYPERGEAEILDWKTNAKKKTDPAQVQLYCAATFADYAWVEKAKCGFVFLNFPDAFERPTVFPRFHAPALWRIFEDKYAQLKDAYQSGVFPPKPSGLCNGWCPLQSCEFWKPKKEKR
ncbi:PD-(D/E)XK nuclease superfamily protein [compost metagenome]